MTPEAIRRRSVSFATLIAAVFGTLGLATAAACMHENAERDQ